MREIELKTRQHEDYVDVTGQVAAAARELGVTDGAVVVFNPHTTAGVTINEGADPDVVADLDAALARMVPWDADYRHDEGNAAAHVKTGLMGSSVLVIVAGGELRLGTWQKIWFCEFDGPRRRRLWVQRAG